MKKTKWYVLITVLFLLFFTASAPMAQDIKQRTASYKIREAWSHLNQTTFMPEGIPGVRWDYYSRRIGGLRSIYANLRSLVSYEELVELAPVDIFLDGPHTKKGLELDAKDSFGHYNPEFVLWLQKNLIPAANDENFKRLTQPFYDSYFRDLARTYYAVYNVLHTSDRYFQEQKNTLLMQIETKNVDERYYTRYENLLDNQHDIYHHSKIGVGGYKLVYEFDPNQTGTAAAFWIRRGIDGTDKEFFNLLKLLLQTYDSYFMRLNSWFEKGRTYKMTKPFVLCKEREKLIGLITAVKTGEKQPFNDVTANKECVLAPKGTRYKKIHHVDKGFTLVDVEMQGVDRLMWTIYLK